MHILACVSTCCALCSVETRLSVPAYTAESIFVRVKHGWKALNTEKDFIKAHELTPDFAHARKGDDGFWVFSSGECGMFRCDEGKAECRRWQLMSVYGMKTPERTFAAIVRKLKYYT